MGAELPEKPEQATSALRGPAYDDEEPVRLHETPNEYESPGRSLVVKLKYFVGMTPQEIAVPAGISVPRVDRDWTMARAGLRTRVAD